MEQVVLTGGLVFARLAAVISGLPIFGSLGSPRQAVIVISAIASFLITPHLPPVAVPPTVGFLVVAVMMEVLYGLLVTLGVRVVFGAISTAGEMMALQMGLALSTLFNPLSRESTASLGTLATWLSGVVFLGSGLHLTVIELVGRSFEIMPPGSLDLGARPVPGLIDQAGQHFMIGVQLAGPLIALHFVLNLLMALLTRLAPRMNVFFALGLTATSVAGLLLLQASLPWILHVHLEEMRRAVHILGENLGL